MPIANGEKILCVHVLPRRTRRVISVCLSTFVLYFHSFFVIWKRRQYYVLSFVLITRSLAIVIIIVWNRKSDAIEKTSSAKPESERGRVRKNKGTVSETICYDKNLTFCLFFAFYESIAHLVSGGDNTTISWWITQRDKGNKIEQFFKLFAFNLKWKKLY